MSSGFVVLLLSLGNVISVSAEVHTSSFGVRVWILRILLGLIAYFSTIAPSMSLGFSAVALPGLLDKNNAYRLTESQASWVASIASIATPIGCFISGPVSDKFGRKASLLCINAITFVGWIIIVIAHEMPENQYSILLIGRIVTGLSTGLASMPASVYMAEISSANLRGMFTTASAIFFSLGVLVVYFLGYLIQDNWGRIALITSTIPCIAMVITIFFLPESPQWLVSKSRESEATQNMTKIYGFKEYTSEVHEEISRLIVSRDNSKIQSKRKNNATSFLEPVKKKVKYFTRPTCLKPFVLLLAYFFFLQFSGTFVIIFYAIDIVKEAGVTIDPYLAIVLIATTRLFGAILVCCVSKNYGRRPPSIVSGVGMTVCMMTLFVYLYLINSGQIGDETVKSLSWLPIMMLVLYFFTSTLGFLTVPFAMAAEVFPTKIRGIATGMVTCLAYCFNFVTVKTYPTMLATMHNHGVFCFYGVMSLVGTIFVITLLPETKGKTLQEIEEYFGKKKNKSIYNFEGVSIINNIKN